MSNKLKAVECLNQVEKLGGRGLRRIFAELHAGHGPTAADIFWHVTQHDLLIRQNIRKTGSRPHTVPRLSR